MRVTPLSWLFKLHWSNCSISALGSLVTIPSLRFLIWIYWYRWIFCCLHACFLVLWFLFNFLQCNGYNLCWKTVISSLPQNTCFQFACFLQERREMLSSSLGKACGKQHWASNMLPTGLYTALCCPCWLKF